LLAKGLIVENSLVGFIGSVITVALIILATRYFLAAKGAHLPKSREGTNLYGVIWQRRVLGLTVGIISVVMGMWPWHDMPFPNPVSISISVVFVALGLSIGAGSVVTDRIGITKRFLWRSRSFHWKDITEIRLHTRQGGAIELRSGSRKLFVDSRFIAFQHLLTEIKDQTGLEPIEMS
jgi:hypothetical protein